MDWKFHVKESHERWEVSGVWGPTEEALKYQTKDSELYDIVREESPGFGVREW